MIPLEGPARSSRPFAAAACLLTGQTLGRRLAGCVDADRRIIRWVDVFTAYPTLSRGEKIIADVACDIWNGSGGAQVADLLAALSVEAFTEVIEALQLAAAP